VIKINNNNKLKTLNIGFNNFVPLDRIIAVVDHNSKSIKKTIKIAKEQKQLIDAGKDKEIESVIIMDTGQVILSSIRVPTLLKRVS
tara:strand:+ start:95 stop:352 length:258 start_codon:yes stop_codon:yes gene_type:complete